jgi:hypothetical protein
MDLISTGRKITAPPTLESAGAQKYERPLLEQNHGATDFRVGGGVDE